MSIRKTFTIKQTHDARPLPPDESLGTYAANQIGKFPGVTNAQPPEPEQPHDAKQVVIVVDYDPPDDTNGEPDFPGYLASRGLQIVPPE